MCIAMEEIRYEAENRKTIEIAKRMIEKGKVTV